MPRPVANLLSDKELCSTGSLLRLLNLDSEEYLRKEALNFELGVN